MALPQILIDSGFLYALLDKNNPKYRLAKATIEAVPAQYLVPYVVLTETAFLFSRAGGVPAVLLFMDKLVAAPLQFEAPLKAGITRGREIMATYASSRLDFVDCCIMAISERLNITKVFTFDWRDFSIFRPKHCPHLELLPILG
jgi:predicted nucleic acid-binding protein